MFDKIPTTERINRAKVKMKQVLDSLLFLIELHANNAFVVYSSTLSSQIRRSYAAKAFLSFQRAMHHYEIVRLCALWDRPELPRDNIPTVVELIDDAAVIQTLVDETRKQWANVSDDEELNRVHLRCGDERATLANRELGNLISDTRSIRASEQLKSVMNLRDKRLAHSLEFTKREEKYGPVIPMKHGQETELLQLSIPIVERLYCWVNGTSFSIADSAKIDRANAEALWRGCKFDVLR